MYGTLCGPPQIENHCFDRVTVHGQTQTPIAPRILFRWSAVNLN